MYFKIGNHTQSKAPNSKPIGRIMNRAFYGG